MAEGSAGSSMAGDPIRELDEQTIQRIAAGEVVERPASVVKELVENSLDAGADRIDVEVTASNGIDRIVVDDDGHGIEPDHLELAVRPHSTSKIDDHVDLQGGIHTLGFRGEALHAIGQVSRLTIASRPPTADAGRRLVLDAGEIVETEPLGIPQGTRVEVEDLFKPVPARRKFLDKPSTERTRLRRVVAHLALSRPDVAISLTTDDRELFATEGDGDPRAAVAAIHGRPVAEAMVAVEQTDPPAPLDWIEGLVSEPETVRSTTSVMTTMVNGRPIDSSVLRRPIIEGYGDRLAPDRYPFTVIDVAIDPTTVDVNVHPRKNEVHFERPAVVKDAIRTAVADAVREASVPSGPPRRPEGGSRSDPGPRPAINLGSITGGRTQATLPGVERETGELAYRRLPSLRIVGQVHDAYLVAESPKGIVLVDQHAADERVRFERLRAGLRRSTQRQRLATPASLELTPEEADAVTTHREVIESIGFRVSLENGEATVHAVPTVLEGALPPAALTDAVHRLLATVLDADAGADRVELATPVLADLACHPAITANETLTPGSMEQLLGELDACDSPWTCPHGRPTIIELTEDELDDRFERDYPGAKPCRRWDDV